MEKESRTGFREILHTADYAIKVWGPDFTHLVQQAANGMSSLMGIEFLEGEGQYIDFDVAGGDQEACMVAILSECLYRVQVHNQLVKVVDISLFKELVKVYGKSYIILKKTREIKAVTYHGLNIQVTPDGNLLTEIVFDA